MQPCTFLRRLSVTNLSSENNLSMFWLNASVFIRAKVEHSVETSASYFQLKLVTDNLLFINTEANWEATASHELAVESLPCMSDVLSLCISLWLLFYAYLCSNEKEVAIVVSFVTVHVTYLSIIWSAKCQLYRPLKDYSHAWKIQKIGIQLIYYLSSYITKLLHMYFHRHTEVSVS